MSGVGQYLTLTPITKKLPNHSHIHFLFIQKFHIHQNMLILSLHGIFIQKCHIHQKMAHSSINNTVIHKWRNHPKMAHSSKNGMFIQKWHLHPKMAHSSKNDTFIQKWHIHPKIFCYMPFKVAIQFRVLLLFLNHKKSLTTKLLTLFFATLFFPGL